MAEHRSPAEREVLFAFAAAFDQAAHLAKEHAEMVPPTPRDDGRESADFHRGWWSGWRFAFGMMAAVLVPPAILLALIYHLL